ncbi:phospholipase [Bacillus sp. FJAT-27916]|uniref:patatin-like phospholipase family protein n=1 Tax=Bacillaceae TaxID=186817 RepID=UPI000671775F|nr:patatin family protein [Bacillus sp. FJAT-27916]KMY45537.1 phospholipase [Bacillus sp. FJAT-27916]
MISINVKNTSLILEGGTFRTVYTAGILDGFLEKEIMFPYILGISAGAISACSYVSEQKNRTIRFISTYRNDKRYIGMRNFLTERSLFGLTFAYDTIPNQLDFFDWETYQGYKGSLLFGVTNAYTGEVEYIDAKTMDKGATILRATCAIPVLFPEIKLNDVPYYDGGLADPIPIQKAIADGYDKHVIILTREQGYRKVLDGQTKWAMKLFRKKYPQMVRAMEKRADNYNQTMELIEKLEREGKAFVYRPPYALKSFEKNTDVMWESHKKGLEHFYDRESELLDFLGDCYVGKQIKLSQ